jgi:hypothetical protein
MPRERVRTAFDDDERKRIRAALWRYKKQYKLGFEKLGNRMADGLGYRGGESFWKTLQRFMNETHGTEHDTVAAYVRFLSMVAPPDPSDRAGTALARFLAGPEFSIIEDLAPVAGRYVTLVRWPFKTTGMLLAGHEESGQVWSVLRLSESAHGAFLRAKERIIDPCYVARAELERGQAPMRVQKTVFSLPVGDAAMEETLTAAMREATRDALREPVAVNSGILAPCGMNQFMLLLRNYLETRLYLLRREKSGGPLHGIAFYPMSFVRQSYRALKSWRTPEFEFTLVPVPESKSEKPSEESGRVRNLTGARKSR